MSNGNTEYVTVLYNTEHGISLLKLKNVSDLNNEWFYSLE